MDNQISLGVGNHCPSMGADVSILLILRGVRFTTSCVVSLRCVHRDSGPPRGRIQASVLPHYEVGRAQGRHIVPRQLPRVATCPRARPTRRGTVGVPARPRGPPQSALGQGRHRSASPIVPGCGLQFLILAIHLSPGSHSVLLCTPEWLPVPWPTAQCVHSSIPIRCAQRSALISGYGSSPHVQGRESCYSDSVGKYESNERKEWN